MKHSESIKEFAVAFVAAQADIGNALKDKENPHFRSKYADLSSVAEACKGPLNQHGIAFLQTPEPDETLGKLTLTTRLLHKSGEWIEGAITVPVPKADPQSYGSALTYARRYGLSSITGVCPDDDDAEGANGRGREQQRTPPPSQQEKPLPEPKPPSEAEQYQILVREAFDARDFTDEQRRAAVVAVCHKHKVTSVDKLSQEKRAGFMKAIAEGTFDKLKNPPKDKAA